MSQWNKRRWYWIGGLLILVFLLGFLYRQEVSRCLITAYRWVSDREQVERFVSGFGRGAPLLFMAFQVFQVVLAPVPGEVTGFLGGYLFGWAGGFAYSSFALALGSWINFGIGRFLGSRFVRRWIPPAIRVRFDHLVKRQGSVVVFLLFVFPGFPKDYLCLFLGITSMPTKIFLLIASIGRMPGTLLLSLQGDYIFEKNYLPFLIAFAATMLLIWLSIRYREKLYKWMENN